MTKARITLSWEEEVLRKAKELGINLSDITEQFMKAYTSAAKPDKSLNEGYQQLFDSILPLMRDFDFNLKIAKAVDDVVTTDKNGMGYKIEIPLSIFLEADGSFYIDEYDKYITINDIDPRDFIEPKKILSNLVDTLAKTKEIIKEKKNEILMAKRIIEAMSKTLVKKHSKVRFMKRKED